MEILRAYKFRIYPTDDQKIILGKTFGCARFVWNQLVQNFNSYGTEDFKAKFDEQTLKKNPEFEFLKEVNASVLVQVKLNFESTKKQFFNKKRKIKLGRPKFKKKSNRQSFRLGSHKRFTLFQEKNLIRIEKIGLVRVVCHRQIPSDAEYRSATVSMTPSGKYFVSILVKEEQKPLSKTGNSVGIDVGLKDLFTLSNGTVINNPRWFRENQSDLARAQRHLSRKRKGSNRYNKQRLKVARIHERVSNSRSYFLHNLTTSLVKNFDLISIEDLDVKGMMKSRKGMAKSILDASWSEFTRQLEYKAEWYEKKLVRIDRWFPSSQICSSCGSSGGKKPLRIREWTCLECGTIHDRDQNAARNILFKGLQDVCPSAELVDYRRGEDVRLLGSEHHLAPFEKRLDESIGSS